MKGKKAFPQSFLLYREMMSYVIPDQNGCYVSEGANIDPNAPQWAKDEYVWFKKTKAEMARLAKDDFKM